MGYMGRVGGGSCKQSCQVQVQGAVGGGGVQEKRRRGQNNIRLQQVVRAKTDI